MISVHECSIPPVEAASAIAGAAMTVDAVHSTARDITGHSSLGALS
jgi:hypothetical protein